MRVIDADRQSVMMAPAHGLYAPDCVLPTVAEVYAWQVIVRPKTGEAELGAYQVTNTEGSIQFPSLPH